MVVATRKTITKCEFLIGKKKVDLYLVILGRVFLEHTSSFHAHAFLVLDGNSKCRTAEHYDTGRHFFMLLLSKSQYMYTPRYHRVLAQRPLQCLFPQSFHVMKDFTTCYIWWGLTWRKYLKKKKEKKKKTQLLILRSTDWKVSYTPHVSRRQMSFYFGGKAYGHPRLVKETQL